MDRPADPQRWAVVGGGMLGLTLALRLRQAGHDVVVTEAAAEFGGLASAWEIGGLRWDRHYHVTLMSDLRTRALLAEVGLGDDMRWVETRTGFYTGGRHYSMSNTLEFLRFPPLGVVDKLRLGATIFYASKIKDPSRLEEVNVCDWLRKLSGRSTFQKIWLPLLRAKLGTNYDRVSAAFIWATIARMYAARRSGLKKEMFGYLPGGYDRFLGALVERMRALGVEMRAGTPVASITTDQSSGRQLLDGEAFDHVAVTAPARRALEICHDLPADERALHAAIEYQGIVCASVVVRKPLAGFYVTNITDPAPFTAVIEMTALVDPAHLGGNHLIYLPKYVPADDAASFQRGDAEIEEEFVAALLRMHPHLRREDIVAFRVSRARDVLALATENYSSGLPPVTSACGNLHIINSSHIVNGTLNVDETVGLAENAAARLAVLPRPAHPTANIAPNRSTAASAARAGELSLPTPSR